ncbi:MAG TPA: mechanosensitive ion channel domain-containing protein, partial [Hyphomicrobiaceae bacterium]|nr:mechanosensitive ion channel domain-containing protein [Hyphomicrobiaceae bacterium]
MVDLSSWMAVLPQVVTALTLILLGLWLARRVEHVLANLLDQHQVLDLTFRGVLIALARYSILLLALIAALQQLGIQATSILAAVGAIFVAIGLALQGTLSNLAAGVMLLWLRPFRVGDAIETASVAGTVTDVGLFATEIRRSDGVY